MIDGNSCNGSHPSGCAHQPFMTVDVGSGPSGIAVNPLTNTIYVANTAEDSNNTPLPKGSTLSVIDGAACKPTDKSGCTPVGTVRVGADPANVAVDPATNSVYVANTYDNTNSATGTVSVVNGANCDASDPSGCASQTPPRVHVGADPVSTAFDATTDTVFVTNAKDKTVSIIDAAHCNATRLSGCSARPPTVTVGSVPTFATVDTDLAYGVRREPGRQQCRGAQHQVDRYPSLGGSRVQIPPPPLFMPKSMRTIELRAFEAMPQDPAQSAPGPPGTP